MSRFAKAVAAFFTSGAGVAATVYADDVVTQGEVVIGFFTVAAATAAVYAVRNTVDEPLQHLDESVVTEPEAP